MFFYMINKKIPSKLVYIYVGTRVCACICVCDACSSVGVSMGKNMKKWILPFCLWGSQNLLLVGEIDILHIIL